MCGPDRLLALVLASSTFLMAACGSTPQLSPTSPSAVLGGGTAQLGNATVTSTGDGPAGSVSDAPPDPVAAPASSAAFGEAGIVTDAAAVEAWAADRAGWALAPDGASAFEVEGTGPITAVAGACPNVVLTIYGIPVTVNGGTLYGRDTTCADLAVGTIVRVRGLVTITNGSVSVLAVRIALEHDRVVEGEGRVLAVSGTCPALTISVDGITVITDAQTLFRPPDACGQIRVGTRVRVRGVPVAGGAAFRALSVVILGHRERVEGEGRITSVAGACPDLTVFIGRIEVRVNQATVYRRGTCADLQPGVKIEASGYRDDGGPIIALVVEFQSRHVEGEGTITALTGACPTLELTVSGFRVVTNAATRYEDGSCADLRVGTRIEVKGDMRTADGAVIAEEIEIEGQPRGSTVEGEGTVVSASGACPARTIVVGGYAASTSPATVYRLGSCADLQPGRRIRARGEVRAGVTHVTEVEFR